MAPFLGWFGVLRLGLVQTALGAVVVISTSTLNRVMVVELALAAMVPGLLVAAHYAVQILRPRWGYGSDAGGRRTPWIVGGMALLCLGGAGAAAATAWMATEPMLGLIAAAVAFLMIGAGVGAAGTSLLVLLATEVAPDRVVSEQSETIATATLSAPYERRAPCFTVRRACGAGVRRQIFSPPS